MEGLEFDPNAEGEGLVTDTVNFHRHHATGLQCDLPATSGASQSAIRAVPFGRAEYRVFELLTTIELSSRPRHVPGTQQQPHVVTLPPAVASFGCVFLVPLTQGSLKDGSGMIASRLGEPPALVHNILWLGPSVQRCRTTS